jgi:hypothetical protein
MKRHARLWSFAAFVLLTSSYGCADNALDATKPTVRSQASASPGERAGTERAALTTLARAIALSLANDAIRAEVLQQMQSAPFREHKLELRKYLNSGMLVRTASASGKRADDIAAALNTVRDLEFYMPVASQRESWTGDANILVASQLDEGEEIVAFDLKGKQVALTEASPPPLPTLTLVPVETRFDQPLDARKTVNVNDRGGNSIGTMVRCEENPAACLSATGNRELEISKVIDCGECGGGGGSSYATPGLYMTFSRIVDNGEPWTRGDPEIEIHIHGPLAGGSSQYGEDLSCSGEHAAEGRRFNQDNAFWNGSVLLFDQYQIDRYNAEFPDGFHILVWEDDDTACTLKFDKDMLGGALASTVAAAGAAALKAGRWGAVTGGLILASYLANIYRDADWLLSNDDYLGAFVTASSHGDYWYDANLTLLKGGVVNGRANTAMR